MNAMSSVNQYPADDCLILSKELPPLIYRKLVLALGQENAWEKVANYLVEKHSIENEELLKMKQSSSPAESLVIELGCHLCDVAGLCEILYTCQLYNALLIFRPPEPLLIIKQPCGRGDDDSLMVQRGGNFNLTCVATGLPPPMYQWCVNNKEIQGCTTSELTVDNFDIGKEGSYYCVMSQGSDKILKSHSVKVYLAPEHPLLIEQPPSQIVCRVGTSATLSVRATGHPQLAYQWYKGRRQLDGFNQRDLTLKKVAMADEGDYKCYIFNTAGEVWSDGCQLMTYASPEDVNEGQARPVASAKLALLIANQKYESLSELETPIEDVTSLAKILEDHGFEIIALQNLNLIEMRNAIKEFCKIVPEGALVLFYFAGHGFEMKDKYMLPVSAPGPGFYMMKDAVSEGELLRDVLATEPLVLVELLDMCLKSPETENTAIFQEISTIHQFSAKNNLIQGYSTTSYLGCYERKADGNGLYVKFLKRYLSQDIPIVTVLDNVAKDMEKEGLKQVPYRGTNVTKTFRLTDPCVQSSIVKKNIQALKLIPDSQVMRLEKCGLCSRVTFVPYSFYCNAMQVIFTNLQGYSIECEIEEDGEELIVERYGEKVVITVLNLQRIKEGANMRLILTSFVDGSIDYGSCSLGKPMIAVLNLWNDPSENV